MHTDVVVGLANLICVGILAGEEFTICYGVCAPLASLDDRPHIQLRQALIRRLRVLVPAVFALALLFGIAVTVLDGINAGFGVRCAGLLALLTFIVITLAGTVPINQAALGWNPDEPPSNWATLVARWERLDVARCWAAIAAFVCFVVAMAFR